MATPAQPSHQKPRSTAAKCGAVEDFGIPADEEDWEQLVRTGHLQSTTISTLAADLLGSGSEASNKQYLMLHTASPGVRLPELLFEHHARYGIANEMAQGSQAILEASEEFSHFLEIIETGQSMDNVREGKALWPGSFAVPRLLQQQTVTVDGVPDYVRVAQFENKASMTAGPRSDSRLHLLPDAEDEIVPNAAAITLFSQLIHMIPCDLEWVMNRAHFTARFGQGSFSAQTDGSLRHKDPSKKLTFAILEVKSRLRKKRPSSILIQEACEVVGWLMDQSPGRAVFDQQ
ncbi:hypothetical protein N7508_007057 [Penicillium antarcticum]|uniref:uncharacterized protein n=1 Tax=Penicillium antarcticum TaxID=416450 RepID=UPI002386CC06|nr:uncharacterized protein N7508_007057 [Penicillium antarcticum]KAJ5302194.1 hypothetical protein N7508_007057 [Penicillium antarcticum]